MTMHQLAALLESLSTGLEGSLKSGAATEFRDAAAALRSLPDQPLRQLAALIWSVADPGAASAPRRGSRSSKPPAPDVPIIIERIRAVRAGTAQDPLPELESLNNNQLREILSAFGYQKTSRQRAENLRMVRALLVPTPATAGNVAPAPPAPVAGPEQPSADAELVAKGVALYQRLRDDRNVSVAEVRTALADWQRYPKDILEEITRRLGFSPYGSRSEMYSRLLANLEDLKMHQFDARFVSSGG